jgi:ribosomal protein L37AE/L43A
MDADSDYSNGDPKERTSPRSGPARRHSHRPPRPKIFQCPHCERSFDRPSLLGQVRHFPLGYNHNLLHVLLLACPDSYRRTTSVSFYSYLPKLLNLALPFQPAHKCPKCDDKRFSRTSNLYRHMRTCKGTSSSKSPTDEAFRSQVRLANITGAAASEGIPSPRSASPTPFAASDPSSPLHQHTLEDIRGISPDPNWGPNPLASWKPAKRRHTLPSFPIPISQRVYVGNLPIYNNNNNFGASPTTTPSPSCLIATNSGTPAGSDSRPDGTEILTQQQRDQEMDWLITHQLAYPGTQSPLKRNSALSYVRSMPSGGHPSSSNSMHSAFDLASSGPLHAHAYRYDLMPPIPRWSSERVSVPTDTSTDGEAPGYLLTMINAVPGWAPSPPPDANSITSSPPLVSTNIARDMYTVPRVVHSQEDATQHEREEQGESLWNTYVDLE